MSKHSIVRWIKIIGVYLLVAAVAALGWLWCALPEEVYLEPEQTLTLPRFGWVERCAGTAAAMWPAPGQRAAIRPRWRWAAGCRSRPSAPP